MSVFGFSSTCHQKPSCSQYCFNQIQKHGLLIGGAKGLQRIIKCH